MMKGTIELEGMEFFSRHGCMEHEKAVGNRFLVDFRAPACLDKAARSDALEDTLDYGHIYQLAAREMARPSNLLEHVAARIVTAIAEAHPELDSFSIRVSKQRPPVDGPTAWARISVEYKRDA